MIKRFFLLAVVIIVSGCSVMSESSASNKSKADFESQFSTLFGIFEDAPPKFQDWDDDRLECGESRDVVEHMRLCVKNLPQKAPHATAKHKIQYIWFFLIFDAMYKYGNSSADEITPSDQKVMEKDQKVMEKDMGMSWNEFGKLVRQWQAEALASKDEKERYFAEMFKPYFD
jgi:hypothetical protein